MAAAGVRRISASGITVTGAKAWLGMGRRSRLPKGFAVASEGSAGCLAGWIGLGAVTTISGNSSCALAREGMAAIRAQEDRARATAPGKRTGFMAFPVWLISDGGPCGPFSRGYGLRAIPGGRSAPSRPPCCGRGGFRPSLARKVRPSGRLQAGRPGKGRSPLPPRQSPDFFYSTSKRSPEVLHML